MAYDAQIRVNTTIDLNDFKKLEKEYARLEKKLETLNNRWEVLYKVSNGKITPAMKKIEYETEQVVSKMKELEGEMSGFAEETVVSMKKGSNFMQKFTKRVWGLAKRVFIFSIIARGFRSMVSAMREGLQNLARYGGEYEKAMSAFKSQTAQLKNGLATAVAPILTALLPALTKLVSWLNTATDAIARFFAILSGKSTYTKAKAQVVEYGKALGQASKEAQKLASFDDLNVLQKDDGGGAGGGASAKDMFEEVEIDKSKFEWVEWLREHLDIILGIVKAIGIAFLGWKVLNILSNLNPIILGLTTLIASVTAVITALHEWITTGNITDEMLARLALGIAGIGFALSMLVGNPIPALIGAIGALVTIIIKYKDQIWNAIVAVGKKIKAWWSQLMTFFKGELKAIGDFFSKFGKSIADGATTIVTNVGNKLKAFVTKIRNGFATFINWIIDGINKLIDKINGFGFDLPSILGGGHVGFNIKKIDRIPMLAEGGIVNRPTMAMVGEAGREAVIPLENNTEFLDALGERLSRDITIKFEGSLAQLAEIMQPALDAVSKRNGTQLRVN